MSPSAEARMEMNRSKILRESKERDREFNKPEFAWRPFVLGVVACAAVFALWMVTHRG
jgi:hypothetical protein